MKNFNYNIPTKVFFGQGQISKLGRNLSKLADSVLLVYGGGSIKENGIYDKVIEELEDEEIRYAELSGVDPNPRIESVRKGAELCREHEIKAVLAVGGGSVIDCAKMIAAAALYKGDAWDLVIRPISIRRALPVAVVLTNAATGSEMDGVAVISDVTKNEKWGTGSEILKPVFAILDPEYTYSVSGLQTAAGTIDIMSHVMEAYFNRTPEAFLQARLCEAVLKTCIHYLPIVLEEPENYEARSNLMWCASTAMGGLLSYGDNTAWSVHPIEHELSAFYDITHGEGLAVLIPAWMDYVLNDETIGKFAEYGRNVWDLYEGSDLDIAKAAIRETREFFEHAFLPNSLSKLGIDERHFDIMAEKAAKGGLSSGFVPLYKDDVLQILKNAL